MLVGKCLCGAVRYAVESPFRAVAIVRWRAATGSGQPCRHRGKLRVTVKGSDYDPGIRPMFHIFVGSKAPWHEITNSLPQYTELPPAEALAT